MVECCIDTAYAGGLGLETGDQEFVVEEKGQGGNDYIQYRNVPDIGLGYHQNIAEEITH